jgi:hypothetical protein|tara:strand:- start:46330 stop:46461 length:132 start_codon:yes stop_codon:yes gene_type:complete
MAVSEPEKYAERMTSRIMDPNKSPSEGSSKKGRPPMSMEELFI